jgi:hypothetical protein
VSTRGKTPTQRGNPPPPDARDGDLDDRATIPSLPRPRAKTPAVEARPPIRAISMKTPADPQMRAISMKTPGDPNAEPPKKLEREMPHIQLRAMSEMSRANQQLLGNLAPPYDPAQARARTVRDYVMWGSLAVALAAVIALVVWVVAA